MLNEALVMDGELVSWTSNDEAPAKSTPASPLSDGASTLQSLCLLALSLYFIHLFYSDAPTVLPRDLPLPYNHHTFPRSILFKIHTIVYVSNYFISSIDSYPRKYTMSASMSRKRKTPEPERDAFGQEQVTTPSNSPARKKLKITQHQKQTLIDNLQLESVSRLPLADYIHLVSILTIFSHRASPPITRPICNASSRSSLTH